ncbi:MULTISPECIES: SCO family protein [unclassified Bradyrhizobium]|jgi:protein SCO1/2
MILGCATLWHSTDGLRAFTSEASRRVATLAHPKPIPDIELIDLAGRSLRLSSAAPRAVVVEFIYTRCPLVCTSLGDAFAQLQTLVDKVGLHDRVNLVSISFDPTDDEERMSDYARVHGADGVRWIIAKPQNAEELPALLKSFGVVVIPDGDGGFVHNAALHVVSPDRRLIAIFDLGESKATLNALVELAP